MIVATAAAMTATISGRMPEVRGVAAAAGDKAPRNKDGMKQAISSAVTEQVPQRMAKTIRMW